MKECGFDKVYQIAGGIVRYGEKYTDKGLWQGSLYTFDRRMVIDFSESPELIGKCDACSEPTKQFQNALMSFATIYFCSAKNVARIERIWNVSMRALLPQVISKDTATPWAIYIRLIR